MRVTGGWLGGRKLVAAPDGVRPTSDRVRESLFQRLGDLEGCRVLDLYAGTGTLGIESVSRGAERVIFVDQAQSALRVLRRNLEQLDLEACSRVHRSDVGKWLRGAAGDAALGSQDLVFLDPPYADGAVESALSGLIASGLLADGGTVVVESAKRHPWSASLPHWEMDARSYGDTVITRLTAPRASEVARGASEDGGSSPAR